MADDQTLKFYADNAASYVARRRGEPSADLQNFLDMLGSGARILELGTGGGNDAVAMMARGFDLQPSDASPELAAQAEARLGRPVRIMRFDELVEENAYDAVWANACLLHAPRSELTADLSRVHLALRPDGIFAASFKAGTGEGRDTFGRYYNYPDRATLERHYAESAAWADWTITEKLGSGYDNQPTLWHWVMARKSA